MCVCVSQLFQQLALTTEICPSQDIWSQIHLSTLRLLSKFDPFSANVVRILPVSKRSFLCFANSGFKIFDNTEKVHKCF